MTTTPKSSFRKTVEKLNEQGAGSNLLPCMWCKEPTAWATLSNYGARCFRCYEAYCAAAFATSGPFAPPKGALTGASDTPQQAEMRKRLKGFDGKTRNVLTDSDDRVDNRAIASAQEQQKRDVAAYARDRGIALKDVRLPLQLPDA